MSDIRIQDDLYEAVNGDWLKTAVIPEDRPMTGGFFKGFSRYSIDSIYRGFKFLKPRFLT